MRKNDYIKTMRAMHMPDDMRARIAQRMAQENEHKEVSISMFKHTQTDFCNRCAGRRSDNHCVSVLGFAPIANQHHGRHQHGCLYLLR